MFCCGLMIDSKLSFFLLAFVLSLSHLHAYNLMMKEHSIFSYFVT